MAICISTACFYPSPTEQALAEVGKLNAGVTEVFFNSPCEMEQPFIEKLCKIRDEYGLQIKSVHNFASFAESYMYFTKYERRFRDGLEQLKDVCEAANGLGADIIVLHGAKDPSLESEQCFERFGEMHRLCRQHGIMLAQENVYKFHSESVDYLQQMKNYLGDDFSAVLDVKQARLAGYSPFDFIDRLGKSIIHLHISDYNNSLNCIPPLEGKLDFSELFNRLKGIDYDGDYIIELYENSFNNANQIVLSKSRLEEII